MMMRTDLVNPAGAHSPTSAALAPRCGWRCARMALRSALSWPIAVKSAPSGGYFRPAAMRGVPAPLAERLRQGQLGVDAPVTLPLLAGESFVHITDLTESDHPLAQAGREGGVRTLLSVPLRQGDALIGLIVAARFEAQPFSEKQIALLQ